jgi:hypothetical protein
MTSVAISSLVLPLQPVMVPITLHVTGCKRTTLLFARSDQRVCDVIDQSHSIHPLSKLMVSFPLLCSTMVTWM